MFSGQSHIRRAVTHAAYPTRLSMRLLWHFVIHQIQSVGFRAAENLFLLRAPKSAPWKQLFRCGADYWTSFLRRANHRTPFSPPPPLAILQITGLSPNDRVLLSSPLKSLSHSFPTHSPTTKKPSYCGADRGEKRDIDRTLVGKDLGLCQAVQAAGHQKNRIFVSGCLWPCLFVYGGAGTDSCYHFPVLKRKKIQFVSTLGPRGHS